MEKAYKNISYLFGAILLLVFAGFFRTYFGLFPHFAGLSSIAHFHAIIILVWFALLISQPILIRYKKTELHRWLGKLSYAVVPLLLLSIALMMKVAQSKAKNLFIFSISLADIIFFVTFYLLAVIYRHKLAYHTRFMVLTVLPFINPALGRFNLPGPILGLGIIIGLLIFERFNRKIYKPYLIALPIFLTLYAVAITFAESTFMNSIWEVFFGK